MNVKLTPKQTAVLADVVRFKLLSTRQIGELHFDLAEKPETTAPANLMRKLKMAGCVKSAYAPLTSTETDTPTRPSAVWFVPPDSLKVIRRVLVEQGRASGAAKAGRFCRWIVGSRCPPAAWLAAPNARRVGGCQATA